MIARTTPGLRTDPSLIAMAESNNLPFHQYMDAATHDWISRHNPRYTSENPQPDTGTLQLLNTLTLPAYWFASQQMVDSIHGQRHLLRCAYLSAYLVHYLSLTTSQARCLTIAALLHDIRRTHDKGDESHGQRSAEWFTATMHTISARWNIALTRDEAVIINAAIALHDIRYEQFTAAQLQLYQDTDRTITDGLKLADALDRYRLPKITWRIQDAYLRLWVPPALKQLAFDFVVESEQLFLQTNDSPYSVMQALEDM